MSKEESAKELGVIADRLLSQSESPFEFHREALAEARRLRPDLAAIVDGDEVPARGTTSQAGTSVTMSASDLMRKRIAEAAGEPVSVTPRPGSLAALMLERVQKRASEGPSLADRMRERFAAVEESE